MRWGAGGIRVWCLHFAVIERSEPPIEWEVEALVPIRSPGVASILAIRGVAFEHFNCGIEMRGRR
jgi:hypothetical protein